MRTGLPHPTEAAGVPIGLAHEGANRHDSKLLAATLDSVPIERPEPTPERPQRLCLDRGYDYEPVRELVAGRGYTAHIRTHGEEIKLKLHTLGWRARRWVGVGVGVRRSPAHFRQLGARLTA